ncbi:lipoprotein insertase outer membrane protein LolB [Marinomonas epiphytica]
MPIRLPLLLLISLVIAACSSQPNISTPTPTSVEAISHWDISGRIGIRTQDDAVSGNFSWQQTPQDFSLDIVGPFGQGATSLSGTNHEMVTLTYKDQVVSATDATTLLQQELGWEFPVEQAVYWVRGLASPNSTANNEFDESGQLAQLQQDGWQIQYRNYTEISGLSLPQRIQISKPPFRVSLIINQWTIQ